MTRWNMLVGCVMAMVGGKRPPALRRRLLDIAVCRGSEVPQQWKDAIIMILSKNETPDFG